MTQATFDDIIAEVKKVNQRLESIERTLSTLMAMLMPKEELSEEEWREIEEIEAEMKSGLHVPLEELEKDLR
jgi:predicted ATP-dependent Lon-type protease